MGQILIMDIFNFGMDNHRKVSCGYLLLQPLKQDSVKISNFIWRYKSLKSSFWKKRLWLKFGSC